MYERFLDVLRTNLPNLSAATAANTTTVSSPADEASLETTNPPPPPTNQHQDELTQHTKQYSNVWINYMRFARRAQGYQGFRDAFAAARKDEHVGGEVYEAAGASSLVLDS